MLWQSSAYPMQAQTWARLAEDGSTITRARLNSGGRSITLALADFSVRFGEGTNLKDIASRVAWLLSALRHLNNDEQRGRSTGR
jgi:hypothetical protein